MLRGPRARRCAGVAAHDVRPRPGASGLRHGPSRSLVAVGPRPRQLGLELGARRARRPLRPAAGRGRRSRWAARRTLLEDPPVADPDAPIGPPGGQQVVRHHHDRHAELAVDRAEGLQHTSRRRRNRVRPSAHRRAAASACSTSADGVAARCCSPPESCPTLWFARSPRSTSFRSWSASCGPTPRRAARTPGRQDVLAHAQVRDEVPRGSLPHEPHAFGAVRGEVVVAQQPEVLAVDIHDRRRMPGRGRRAGSGSSTCPRRWVRRRRGTHRGGRPDPHRRARQRPYGRSDRP